MKPKIDETDVSKTDLSPNRIIKKGKKQREKQTIALKIKSRQYN